jgi:hypothetical protein
VARGLFGNQAWGDLFVSPQEAQAMNDPWAWGLAFLLGVIVGHHFSTVCPW